MPDFPDRSVGGYSLRDGTVAFYAKVNSLVNPDDTVIDLGAGRGRFVDDPVTFRRDLRMLRGKVGEMIAVDVDPIVTSNIACDRAVVMPTATQIPLQSGSVDLAVSDFTFEHVADPGAICAEFHRILKPGGWLCARTPNRWGYIGIATNSVPNKFHTGMLNRIQPNKLDRDTFPTAYRMNTKRQLRGLFPSHEWELHIYGHNPEVSYFGSGPRLPRFADAIMKRAPESLSATWHIFAQRRA